MSSFVIILPTWGSPYILDMLKKDDDNRIEVLQKGVGGYIEPFSKQSLIIHPGFENKRWRMADALLKTRSAKVWVNEEGSHKFCPNGGVVITHPALRVGGCPHPFGDVVLEVSVKEFMNLKFNSNCLRLHDKCISKDTKWKKFKGADIEDDEDMERMEKWCKENDYEFIESTGAIYLAKC